jgi:hypothetical protein
MSSVISHLADFRSRSFSSTKLLRELISFERNFILAARISSSSAAPDESGRKNLLQMAQIILIFSEIYGT